MIGYGLKNPCNDWLSENVAKGFFAIVARTGRREGVPCFPSLVRTFKKSIFNNPHHEVAPKPAEEGWVLGWVAVSMLLAYYHHMGS